MDGRLCPAMQQKSVALQRFLRRRTHKRRHSRWCAAISGEGWRQGPFSSRWQRCPRWLFCRSAPSARKAYGAAAPNLCGCALGALLHQPGHRLAI